MTRSALVTGAAGFIGSHVVDRLLGDGWLVTGLDDFNDFYATSLKRRNVAAHLGHPRYKLVVADIRDPGELASSLHGSFDVIVHLAARAGVRPSLADPVLSQETNVGGTQNVLEVARVRGVPHVVFASSTSVYGVKPRVPWSESDSVLLPISPYASTKISGGSCSAGAPCPMPTGRRRRRCGWRRRHRAPASRRGARITGGCVSAHGQS